MTIWALWIKLYFLWKQQDLSTETIYIHWINTIDHFLSYLVNTSNYRRAIDFSSLRSLLILTDRLAYIELTLANVGYFTQGVHTHGDVLKTLGNRMVSYPSCHSFQRTVAVWMGSCSPPTVGFPDANAPNTVKPAAPTFSDSAHLPPAHCPFYREGETDVFPPERHQLRMKMLPDADWPDVDSYLGLLSGRRHGSKHAMRRKGALLPPVVVEDWGRRLVLWKQNCIN